MTQTSRERHLDRDALRAYLSASTPAAVLIDGTPRLKLVIEPSTPRLAIHASWKAADLLPDLSRYRFLDISLGADEDGDWIEFGIAGHVGLVEAYPALIAIADRIQLDSDAPGTAIDHVLTHYRDLLSSVGKLTDKQAVGLFGELLLLNHLIDRIGAPSAVESWRGPRAEEHDFGLSDFDLEVKSTLSEGRTHPIASITQLDPTPGRDLWLLSVPLTDGGVTGRTLPDLIHLIANQFADRRLLRIFRELLDATGWDFSQEHLYTRRFTLRDHVLAWKVTPTFPAITPATLAATGAPHTRIRNVSYVIDLAGLPHGTPPSPLQDVAVP